MKIPTEAFSNEERVAMGTRCRDCDDVPKVAEAGMVFEDPDGRRLQIMHNGLRVLADGYYGPWMTDLIRLCQGHHEPQEERIFHEVVRHLPGDATMIELGGFWAYYSLWFLLDRPDRRALTVEPDPAHLDVGRANAWLNRLAPDFLWGHAGRTASPAEPFATESSGEQTMPRFSVESLLSSKAWPHLDLLHCDIQGAELAILESCRDMFAARRIEWVFISTHARQISGDPLIHQRCLALLRDCGAVIETEHDVHESFSGDGLIVARFCPAPPGWTPVRISHNRHSHSLFRALAYDLDASAGETAALRQALAQRPAAPEPNSGLARRGTLLSLTTDGPLGRAGDSLLLPDDRVMSPAVLMHASWDYGNIEEFCAHITPGKPRTLVDIGGNVGLFTRQLAARVPDLTRIVCVEPDRYNFQALRYNTWPLGDRVELHNIALGNADEEREFFRDDENIGNYSLNPDAMRSRTFQSVKVSMRDTARWMEETLSDPAPLLWKSDTQGFDEVIVSATPMAIWRRIEVAQIEIWRIEKPDFDREAFRARIGDFPNRKLGDDTGVSADAVLDYLSGDDWAFKDLFLWR